MKKIAIFRWLVSMSKCNLMWILDFVLIHSQATIDGFKFRLIQGYQVWYSIKLDWGLEDKFFQILQKLLHF